MLPILAAQHQAAIGDRTAVLEGARLYPGESGALRRMALPQNAHGARNAPVTGGDSWGRGDDDPRMAVAWRSVQQSRDPG